MKIKDQTSRRVWNIMDRLGNSKRGDWNNRGWLDSYLRSQGPGGYLDELNSIKTARKRCHAIYDGGSVVEYDLVRIPISVVDAGQYIDELFDKQRSVVEEANKKSKIKMEKERTKEAKKALEERKKLYRELKKEFGE